MNAHFIRLDGRYSSYIIDCSVEGLPLCRYWGRRLPDNFDIEVLPFVLDRPMAKAGLDQDVALTLLPESGLGWFGNPGLMGCRGRRDWATAFKLIEVETAEKGLILHGRDDIAELELALEFILEAETDVLIRRTQLHNAGTEPYHLDWCAAGVFGIPQRCVEVLNFDGHWSQEFRENRQSLGIGSWCRENRRGRTSHDSAPQFFIGTESFGNDAGEVYGFHLGWSGNHRIMVESLNEGVRVVQLGEWLTPGEVVLEPGQSYTTPKVYASYSAHGLNDLSDNFHHFVRQELLQWPRGNMKPRPVHLNTWEAIYFEHDLSTLKELVQLGADLGVERFVLDDGWFKGRDHDRAGLGDWVADSIKYPQGLEPLTDYVHSFGMEFGLWIEPEMVSPDSDLYREHPDWVMQLANRPHITGRNQLVLDLSNPEVFSHLLRTIGKLLKAHTIDYLKWDMNRDLTNAGSSRECDAPAYRGQTLALYALLDQLRKDHPDVEIEACASGAARADFGILEYTHRIWTSDNNDALDRQSIQRGFLRFFPPELMGSHIGAAPAHVTHRCHSLAFRAATALFGHLGLELDIRSLSNPEQDELRGWIELYKQFRGLLHSGRTYQLSTHPVESCQGHGVVAEDRSEALFSIVQLRSSRLRFSPPIRLPGLDPRMDYRLALPGPLPPHIAFDTPGLKALEQGQLVVPGAVLANVGLQTPILPPETVLLLHLKKT